MIVALVVAALIASSIGVAQHFRTQTIEGTYLLDGGKHYIVLENKVWGLAVKETNVSDNANYEVDLKQNILTVFFKFPPPVVMAESGFYRFEPSKKVAGDWDLMAFYIPDVSFDAKPLRIREPLVVSPPIPSALHRVEDERVASFFKSADANERNALVEGLIKAHPNDLFVKSLYLDQLVSAKNVNQAENLLSQWKDEFLQSANPYLRRRPDQVAYLLEGLRLSERGENAWDFVHDFIWKSAEEPGWDLPTLLAKFAQIREYSHLIPRYRNADGTEVPVNYLHQQIVVKVLATMAVFQMIEGEFDQALDLILSLYHLGSICRNGRIYFESRIGIAFQAIALGRLQMYAENCCEDTNECLETLAKMASARPEFAPLTLERFIFEDPLYQPFADSNFSRESVETAAKTTDARFALVQMTLAAKAHLFSTGAFPASSGDWSALGQSGLPDDPFQNGEKMRYLPGSVPFFCYSVGPDKTDNKGEPAYDPSNGAISGGDLRVAIPNHGEIPFSAEGIRASSRAEFMQQFPNGLPTDPFADTRGGQLGVSDSTPVFVYSFGPDQDESEHADPAKDLELMYDPTNGTISDGDLWMQVPVRP